MLKPLGHPRKVGNSIIVVGNGYTGQRLGDVIDSFDEVVRINSYVLSGYESFVGSRTTVWCYATNNWLLNRDNVQSRRNLECRDVWLRKAAAVMKNASYTYGMMFQAQDSDARTFVVPDQIEQIATMAIGSFPSTGFIALLMALSMYKTVHYANFSGLDDKGRYSHYWEKARARAPCTTHAWRVESRLLSNLRRTIKVD